MNMQADMDALPRNDIIIRNWLYFNAFMVFCMAIIGAITRLTESGLSIVEWQPISGTLPPLNPTEWNRVFDLYRQTPEYRDINTGMSLDEFKTIFFWEWFHRLWGRLIGLVYAIPLAIFWIKGMIPTNYKKPLLGLLILGGLQGVMGYVMVLSGLVDQPSVSHYRLAAHLSLAFILYGCLLWTAFSLSGIAPKPTTFCMRRHGWTALGVLTITIIWGAFMAGMDAGLVSNTWPNMYDGQFIPDDLTKYIANNAVTVHFFHRWVAVLALVLIATFAWRVKSFALGGMVFLQFALGIATIMSSIAIPIATMHQGGAFLLTALLLLDIYRVRSMV